jgi:F0F1-type ATP synthase assembly protein I
MAESPPKTPKDDASVLKLIASASSVGFEFLATVLLPGWLGYWMDGKFGTRPILMIALGVFGFAVGLYRMLKLSKTMK